MSCIVIVNILKRFSLFQFFTNTTLKVREFLLIAYVNFSVFFLQFATTFVGEPNFKKYIKDTILTYIGSQK